MSPSICVIRLVSSSQLTSLASDDPRTSPSGSRWTGGGADSHNDPASSVGASNIRWLSFSPGAESSDKAFSRHSCGGCISFISRCPAVYIEKLNSEAILHSLEILVMMLSIVEI